MLWRVGFFTSLSGGSPPGALGEDYRGGFIEWELGRFFGRHILMMHSLLTVALYLTIYFFQLIILSNFWLPHYRVFLYKETVIELFP